MVAILVCGNGEPEYSMFRYIGPFDGRDHAKLWLRAVHQGGFAPCRDERHRIELLENPHQMDPPLTAEQVRIGDYA